MAKGFRRKSRRGLSVAPLLGGLKLPVLVLGGLSMLPTDVLAQNVPPTAGDDVGIARSGPTAGEEITIDAAANDSDPDGDPLNFSGPFGVSGPGPIGTAIVGPSGTIRYTPAPGYSGDDVFIYEVDDGINPPVSAYVTVTVVPDVPPVAGDDTATTVYSAHPAVSTIEIPVLQNDTDGDGDILAYKDVRIVAGPQNGSLSQSCLGNCLPHEYRPNNGFVGTDTFTYQAVDALGGASNVATVTITVTPNPPTGVDDTAVTDTNVTVPIDVLGNDLNPADSPLVLQADSSSQQGGTVALVAGEPYDSVAYTPPSGFAGTDTFTYRVLDDVGGQSSATVRITVNALPPPVAVIGGGDRTVADSDGAPGETVNFDSTDSFHEGGEITSCTWLVNGTSQDAGCGSSVPLPLSDGANTVELIVYDGDEASAPDTVTITVEGANAVPVVTIEVGSTSIPDSDGESGESVPFQGSAVDSDGTVPVSSYRWYVNDELVADANGQAEPVLALQNGANTIVLTATDTGGASGSDSVVVTIGDSDGLASLPGIEGNENLENTAEATDATCSALLKADPSTLSDDQRHLRATCETIYAHVDEDPDGVADAIKQISAQQVTAQQSVAIDFSSAQLLNVAGRLTALRQGASGFSVAGLNISGPGTSVPLHALASLGRTLFGEGGSGGDDEGGLLDDRLGVFINGSVRFGDKDATDRESGFDFDTLGVTVGADYRFTDALVAGIALGYGSASADFDAKSGSQDSDSYSGSLYGSWYGERSYIDGILSIGSVSYDTVRKINLFDGAIVDEASGSTDGTQWAIGVATGWDFGRGGLRFGPNLAVNYITVDVDGFREKTSGTSGLAMAFDDQSADSLTGKLGGHLSYSLSRKWGVLSPQARFDLVREFANESQKVTIRYANDPVVVGQGGAGNSFVIFTDDPDEYYFLWAVGLAAQFANGLSGFVDYEQTEGLDTISTGEVSFGLRFQTKFR